MASSIDPNDAKGRGLQPQQQPLSKDWHRDSYIISTKRSLVQSDALGAALDSDLLWWAQPLPKDDLETMLDHSLSFGLYCKLPDSLSTDGPAKQHQPPPAMVGYARLITDYVTFAYLTDVYILAEHRARGLGVWLMRCVDEVLEEWPHLRRLLIVTGSPDANRLYKKTLGAMEWGTSSGVKLGMFQKEGAALKRSQKPPPS